MCHQATTISKIHESFRAVGVPRSRLGHGPGPSLGYSNPRGCVLSVLLLLGHAGESFSAVGEAARGRRRHGMADAFRSLFSYQEPVRPVSFPSTMIRGPGSVGSCRSSVSERYRRMVVDRRVYPSRNGYQNLTLPEVFFLFAKNHWYGPSEFLGTSGAFVHRDGHF